MEDEPKDCGPDCWFCNMTREESDKYFAWLQAKIDRELGPDRVFTPVSRAGW